MDRTATVGTHKTSIRTEDGMTHIRYHNTDVVSFNEIEIILRSGGYQTLTTKTRMNQAARQFGLAFRVFQKNHEWFVEDIYAKASKLISTIPFFDGMRLSRA